MILLGLTIFMKDSGALGIYIIPFDESGDILIPCSGNHEDRTLNSWDNLDKCASYRNSVLGRCIWEKMGLHSMTEYSAVYFREKMKPDLC